MVRETAEKFLFYYYFFFQRDNDLIDNKTAKISPIRPKKV